LLCVPLGLVINAVLTIASTRRGGIAVNGQVGAELPPGGVRSLTLITKTLTEQLRANGRAQRAAIDNDQPALDFKPVVKLFTPDAQCTWLLTELDPDDGLAFGLCDLGLGCPELGYVSLIELQSVRGKLGLPIERDQHFEADKTISAYAVEARIHRHVT
jgi:hypothetical protein